MKQTNNAIKFLMAQYRAIFKHAYLKGLASAVILTAGLAGGASNAVASFTVDQLEGTEEVTIDQSISSESTAITKNWNAQATVSTESLSFIASGSNAITLSGNGSLTVALTASNKTFTLLPSGSAINIDISTVNVNEGTFEVGKADSAQKARIGATTFNVGTDEGTAILNLGTSGTIGAATAPTKLGSTLQIGSNGSLLLGASGAADYSSATINVADVKLFGKLDTQATDTAASGSLTINLLQGTMSGDDALFTVQSGDKVILNFGSDTENQASNTFDVQSGKVTVAGTLNVSGGTLQLGSKTLDTASAGKLDVQTSGTLAISSTDLKDANSALLTLSTTSSTLKFTDTNQVDLSNFTFADTASAGKIGVSASAIIKADNLAVSEALETLTAMPSLEAETLTLGTTSTNGGDLGFSGATTKSINFQSKDGFVLKNDVTLRNINAEEIAGSDGSISGDVTVSGTKTLAVDGGIYTDSHKLTLDNGTLEVTNTKDADTSKLTLTGDVAFVNTNGSNTVTVSGSGAVLDLSQAKNITVTVEDTSNKTDITASNSGTLVVNQKNIEQLFSGDTTKSGSSILLNKGTLQVSGDLSLDEGKLASANTASDRTIAFHSDGGTLDVSGKLTISGSNGSINIGNSGEIIADTLNLQNVKSGTVTLASGKFTAINGLSTLSNTDTVILTSGNLTLGQPDEDEKTGTYTSAEGGQVLSNLKISGSGDLTVKSGVWTIEDLTLDSGEGTAIIGGDATAVDANGNAIKTTVTGNKLTVANSAGSVTVKSTGTATFDKADIAKNGGLVVSGTATINGEYTPANTDPETPASYGVSLSGSSISIGSTGTLTLGKGIAQAITVSGSTVTIDEDAKIAEGAIAVNGGKLVLAFESGSFDADALQSLKNQLIAGKDLNNGVIDIGNAEITGLDEKINKETNELSWDDASAYEDVLESYTNENLTQAVITGIDASDGVKGHFGALTSDTLNSGSSINLTGNTSLSTAANNDGYFATGVDGAVLGLNVSSNKALTLANGGEAGKITLGTGAEVKIINGETTLAAIDGTDDSVVTLSNAATTVNGNAKAATFTTNANSNLVVKGNLETLTGSDASTFEGNVQVSGNAKFNSKAELSGNENVFAQSLTTEDTFGIYGDTQVKDTATFNNGADVAEGATLTAKSVVLKADTVLSIGSDGDEETSGSTGYLDVGTLALNGGILVIDPDYTHNASVGAIDKLEGTSSHNTSKGGVLSGSIAIGQNSGLMIGADASQASMLEFMQQLPGFNGALNKDDVGAVAYLTSQITIAKDSKLIVDSANTKNDIVSGSKIDPDYLANIGSVDLYLGKNSALAVGDTVLAEGEAIYFDRTGASIKGEEGSKIILAGDAFLDQDTITLFKDGDGDGVLVSGVKNEDDIRVETLNGLMYFTLTAGETTTAQSLKIDTVKAKSAFLGASSPVRESLLQYAFKTVNYQDSVKPDAELVAVVGNVADQELFKVDAAQGTFDFADGVTGLKKDNYILQDGVVYERAYNSFLQKVTRNSNSGIEADQAARLAAFGGAMQAALSAGATTYDAISGRMGIGAQTGAITFADNGQGAGLWVTPVYKNHDSDGFEAQGLGYGVDMDLYGLALGADYSLGNGLRVGAAFNVGSGDADGQGAGSVVSNDFDYYGFAVYGGYTLGALSLVGDVSYTVVDNDLEANTAADKLTTSTDTSILSVGVTGQYTFNLTSVDVTPHAGLRYSYLDMDDYNVTGSDGVVGNYTADSMSVFSIPVGVTFAKNIVSGDWTIKPALDLTLTANMGDDTTDGTMSWSGVSNMNTAVQTEVLDNWTYGATLGVAAKSGNLSFGFGVNYTGSSSADEYGVGANARFVF